MKNAHTNKSLGEAQYKHELQTVKQQQELVRQKLAKNNYQLLVYGQKLAQLQKKQTATERLLQLAELLKPEQGKLTDENLGHRLINLKVAELEYSTHATQMLECEIKVELLELEKSLLEQKMQKTRQTLEKLETSELNQ